MTKYKLRNGLVVDKIGKKLKIFDGEASVFHTFNNTATFILNQINNGIEESEIVISIEKNYKISSEIAQKDFNDLVNQLKLKGIIE